MILGLVVSALGLIIQPLHFLWSNAWTTGLIVSGLSYYFFMKNDQSLVSRKEYDEITKNA